jgi:hypothetical protein
MSLPIPKWDEEDFGSYVSWYLMSSYIYYFFPHLKPPVSDAQFDKICTRLLLDFKNIKHRHKNLLCKDALKAGTGFHLKEEDYPEIVKHSASGLYQERVIR